MARVAFHTFILKVASRCNLNCDYCFVYNKADEQWSRQPRFMSAETLRVTCNRIVEHAHSNGKSAVSIVFHGGEPLLLGEKRFDLVCQTIRDVLSAAGLRFSIGMQTNVTLLTRPLAEICAKHRVTMGVSVDGSPRANDLHRVDHRGRPSSPRVEAGLALLAHEYRQLFSGILSVVTLAEEPKETIDYLAKFRPPMIDFLLPYDNWDVLPDGKTIVSDTAYGTWLRQAFDYWATLPNAPRIRIFESYFRCLLGKPSLVESVGVDPVDLIVIETNGEIEAVDSLKAAFDGSTKLGLSVLNNSFDEALNHLSVKTRQQGASSLCAECQQCSLVAACGGGYLPNRFSRSRGFDNPSIYCSDYRELIPHIGSHLLRALREAEAL